MKVSVIIPTYNASKYLKESINSVLNQTYKNYEIIVIDDGSTDDTKNVLQKYIKNKEIKYIYQKNKGQAAARNNGIKYSTGDLISFLDADDLWIKDKLDKQVKLFNNSEVGLVYGGFEWFNENKIIKKNISKFRGNLFSKLLIHNFICNSTVVIRKSAFELLNESMKFHGVEDYDLWLKIARKWKIDYVNGIVCRYRVHLTNTSSNIEKRYVNELNVKKQYLNQVSERVKRDSLWDTNFNIAYSYFNLENKKKGFYFLRNAIKNKPFNIRNYKLFVKNLIK